MRERREGGEGERKKERSMSKETGGIMREREGEREK